MERKQLHGDALRGFNQAQFADSGNVVGQETKQKKVSEENKQRRKYKLAIEAYEEEKAARKLAADCGLPFDEVV